MASSTKKKPIPWSSDNASAAAVVADVVADGVVVVVVAVPAAVVRVAVDRVAVNQSPADTVQRRLAAYLSRWVARASSPRARAIASASSNSTGLPSASLARAARIASKAPAGVGTG